jgi:hypothetical protein
MQQTCSKCMKLFTKSSGDISWYIFHHPEPLLEPLSVCAHVRECARIPWLALAVSRHICTYKHHTRYDSAADRHAKRWQSSAGMSGERRMAVVYAKEGSESVVRSGWFARV